MNSVAIIGRLTKDPELKYIQGSGTAVAKSTIAVNRDYKTKDGSTVTDFIPLEAMGKIAETFANYVKKGHRVAIQGSIRVDRYETEGGEHRTYTKIQVNKLEFLESKSSSNTATRDYIEYEAIEDEDVPF